MIGPGLVATFMLARMSRNLDVQGFLLTAMMLAIGVRLLALTLIHQSVGPAVFAPDTNVYRNVSQELLQSWQGLPPHP